MEECIKDLVQALRQNGKAYNTTGGKEIRVSCPYCKDRGHVNDPKMYISLEAPYEFHCFRCETSGVLNNRTLADFKINDTDLVQSILKSAKSSLKNTGKKRKNVNKLKNKIENLDLAAKGLEYFNSRYGSSYTINDIEYLFDTYKLILDPSAFLNTVKAKKASYFDYDNSIGFLSNDQNYAIFRNTNPEEKDFRYSNVCLGDKNGSKMFTIGTEVNVLSEKIQLIMTEGIFDIIGVYEHYYKNQDNKSRIFAANCGKSYRSTIEKIIRMGFLDLDIVIYSDGDVNVDFYKNMKKDWSILKRSKITIYYNTIGKDYGVKKSDIILRKVVI